jgi:hypothetical protein
MPETPDPVVDGEYVNTSVLFGFVLLQVGNRCEKNRDERLWHCRCRGLGLLVLITCAVAISIQFSVKIAFS